MAYKEVLIKSWVCDICGKVDKSDALPAQWQTYDLYYLAASADYYNPSSYGMKTYHTCFKRAIELDLEVTSTIHKLAKEKAKKK